MRYAIRPISLCVLIAATLQLANPPAAVAQASIADKAAAQVLFDEGRRLLQAGSYADACKRFEQSQAIEVGIGTLLYLADCYEHLDRTASAWALFTEAASRAAAAGENERASAGRRRADALKPRLSTLTVEVPEPHVLPGLEIVREGELVPSSVWGIAVPIDPGDYTIIARARGHASWSRSLHVGTNAERASLTIPTLPRELNTKTAPTLGRSAELAPNAESPGQGLSPEPRTGAAPVDTAASPLPALGISMASVGGVALVVGAIFGARAISKNEGAKAFCPDGGSLCNSPRGIELTDQANVAATVANVLFAGGGALLLGGAVLYLTAPHQPERSGLALVVGSSSLKLTLTEAF